MAAEIHELARDALPSAQRRWLEIVLIFLVFFIYGGAPAPQVNETCYLTKAKHYWNPEWCAGDLFLESADAHLVFYWTVGWLTKFFSLATVAWIGRVVAWVLLAWSWQRLSGRVSRQPFASVLSAALMVWLVGEMNFAGEWVVGGVEGKCFAYVCVFAGLAAMADGRWTRAWPWFGLAGAFHVIVGGWSAIAAAWVWLLERREERPSLMAMLPSLVLGLVLALPGIVPALQLTRGVSSEVSSEASQIYVFDRLPHHLAPLSQDDEVKLKRTLLFSVPLLAFLLLWWSATKPSQQGERINVELTRLCRFAAWTFCVSTVGLFWEVACTNHPATAAMLLKYYWFRLADVAVPVATAFLICYWIEGLARAGSKLALPALVIAVALPTSYLANTSLARWQDGTPPADKKMFDPAAWREACEWVRDNTPAEAMFLVPRGSQSLSWYADRKHVVTWKDLPQDAASIITWRDRYFDVYLHEDEFGEYVPYRSLAWQGTQRIRELVTEYDVDFVITRDYPPLGFPVAHANDWYTVYATSPAAEDFLK